MKQAVMRQPLSRPSTWSLAQSLNRLTLSSAPICPQCLPLTRTILPSTTTPKRTFTTTRAPQNWLMPRSGSNKKDRKGRPRVPTGGSMRGTTVVRGDYGLRLLDHHRRISAAQLKNGEEAIRKRLRGMRFRLYTRICANIGVYTKGNESRMGKGKGSFDHWASRVAISKIVFELSGDVHEQIVRDAFRLAGNKLPGNYEFVKKGDPPVMGIAKVVNPIAEQQLRSPRREMPLPKPSLDSTAGRLGHSVDRVPPIQPDPTTTPAMGASAS